MNLDIHTLFLVTVYVEAILGLLLLFAWLQNRAIRGVAWWGCAHLLRALSIVLYALYDTVPDIVSIDLANAILLTTFAITWTGARVFDGRPANPVGMVAGAALWVVLCRTPLLYDWLDGRILLSSGIIAAYTWLTAYEFWLGRSEPLVSRWPAIFMLFAHGSLFLLRTPIAAMLPWSPLNQVFGSVWLTVLSFEALLFTISIAFILLAMAKERTELQHKTAAMLDPLTGLANRRAFLHEAADMSRRKQFDSRPVAVLLIDLDHFKSINDRFGHALGDRVLQVFAQAATANLGPADLVGRLGGEEFAALLYDAHAEKALEVAHAIRCSFADEAREIDRKRIDATLSVGVAVHDGGPFDLAPLLALADQALYRAKQGGRNRVELASLEAFVARQDAVSPLTPVAEKPAA